MPLTARSPLAVRRLRAVAVCIAVLCAARAAVFADHAASDADYRRISTDTQRNIDRFMTLRMTLSTLPTRDDAVAAVRAFERDTVSETRSTHGEMEALILENFIVMELFNCYYDDPPMSRAEFRQLLADQKAKNDAFFKATKGARYNAWFWATSGDVFSCWTTFSIKDILFYGMEIRDYYLAGYAEDAHCSYLLTDVAQWYLNAPKVAGGSKSKAKAYFEAARAAARTEAETYFADIFLSQFLFEQKDYQQCTALLDEAAALNPGSSYIALLRAQNAAGRSLYQYNRKRSNIDATKQ